MKFYESVFDLEGLEKEKLGFASWELINGSIV